MKANSDGHGGIVRPSTTMGNHPLIKVEDAGCESLTEFQSDKKLSVSDLRNMEFAQDNLTQVYIPVCSAGLVISYYSN